MKRLIVTGDDFGLAIPVNEAIEEAHRKGILTAASLMVGAAAAEDARKIVESAEQEIAAAAKLARRELTAYAADLAVSLATKQIKVDSATDQGLVRSFAQQLSDGSPPRKDGR